MSRSNPLDPAWTAYQVTVDCFRVAHRALSHGSKGLFAKTTVLSSGGVSTQLQIEESRAKADELIIVALWAEFERFLIAYLQNKSRAVAGRKPKELTAAFHGHMEEQIERWKVEDILDLFKTVIDSTQIGQAKQVKQFRDWVAHKNPRKGTPAKADPQTTYVLLSGIIADIQKA